MPMDGLDGCKVVVDVQHLYRDHLPNDQGTVYRLLDGTTVTEGSAALRYGAALAQELERLGARVLTNDAKRGILVGYYSHRNHVANDWGTNGASAYLACHVNAGRGAYALTEYMAGSPGQLLGDAIVTTLRDAFPGTIANGRVNPLTRAQRGSVCIRECAATMPALILEPFFGDYPLHQALLNDAALQRVGVAIAQGVNRWWTGQRAIAGRA